ncbi:hypothetical protein Tco_1082499 [Tanacetum coccineum]|uniref:Uncharacterized protein n=1 Tax=Tanacetum coccineum TaxID=301880 RepID=A0ABQ5I0P6_9ASTR
MPPRMTTRSVGRSTTTPRGGVTGGRVGRGARRTKSAVRRNNETIGELDSQGNDQAQVGSQDSNQGNVRNQNGDAVNDNIQGDVRNIIMELVQDMSGCGDNQKVKYTAGLFVDSRPGSRDAVNPTALGLNGTPVYESERRASLDQPSSLKT